MNHRESAEHVNAVDGSHTTSTAPRISIIDPLRGIAALSVAWFHFTHGSPAFLHEGWLKATGTYGWAGVDVFFVISGFVLPYSMYRGGYRVQNHWVTFFKKRLTRLEPPYLASVLLTLLLLFLASRVPGFAGAPIHLKYADILQHIAYLNAFTGGAWLNPVYWTLAVEFQFYLTISFLFPLFIAGSPLIRTAAVSLLALLSLANDSTGFVVHYLALFALGIVTFQYFVGLVPRRLYLLLALGIAIAAVAALEVVVGIVALGTSLTIAFARVRPPALLVRLGAISYSLYLLHVPIGGRVVNLGNRLPYSIPVRLVTLLIAAAVSLGAAYLFARLIEEPAQRWSSSIRYSLGRGRQHAPELAQSLPPLPKTEPSL